MVFHKVVIKENGNNFSLKFLLSVLDNNCNCLCMIDLSSTTLLHLVTLWSLHVQCIYDDCRETFTICNLRSAKRCLMYLLRHWYNEMNSISRHSHSFCVLLYTKLWVRLEFEIPNSPRKLVSAVWIFTKSVFHRKDQNKHDASSTANTQHQNKSFLR